MKKKLISKCQQGEIILPSISVSTKVPSKRLLQRGQLIMNLINSLNEQGYNHIADQFANIYNEKGYNAAVNYLSEVQDKLNEERVTNNVVQNIHEGTGKVANSAFELLSNIPGADTFTDLGYMAVDAVKGNWGNVGLGLGLALIPGLGYGVYKNAKKFIKMNAITKQLDSTIPVFKKPSLLPRTITSSTTPTIQTGSNNKLWDLFRIKSSERPSYLSEAERMGVPKGERNLVYNPRLLQLNLGGSHFNKDEVPILFGDVFGKHLGAGANKQTFMSAYNPNKVLKVDIWHGVPHNEDIMTTVLPNQSKNKAPFYKKTKYKGFIYDDYRKYPIYEQDYIPNILTVDDFDPVKIKTQFAEYGYVPARGTDYHYTTPEGFRDADYFGLQFVNPKTGIGYMDLRPDNMTLQNGRYLVFDMDSFLEF